ncbi:hypothetical protein GCM10009623_32440 [Nocardioides aestuarii]|uniref:Uncharacterized protein n=1 Tax=Nocardioides aestuarii TaxID=252231 RepID=A0ABW4TP25_9ACTN
MGKGTKKQKKAAKHAAGCGTLAVLPKKKCCESKKKCARCPLRMLREGTLPEGYTVRKRKLVTVAAAEAAAQKKSKKKAA